MSCIGTPISWLRLEQHFDRSLPDTEHAQIEQHLASCAACAECFAQIEGSAAAALPPLVLPARSAGVLTLRRVAPVVAALAVAAALLFVLRRRGDRGLGAPELDPLSARTKGGSVGFALVREDEGLVTEAGGVYRDGDRWKALVTCPADMHAAFDVVVYEGGQAEFPLAPQPELTCGNQVALPGAFRTTGRERMTICLVWSEDGAAVRAVDRTSLRGREPQALDRASCKTLVPAP